jgi:transcriptional regulator with XRE-family HTH domain
MAMKMKELRQIRRMKDLTQEELAERSGVSLAAIHKAETGAHSPRLSTLMALADGLGVSVHDLIPENPKAPTARYFELSLSRLLGASHRDRALALETASPEERDALVEEIDEELEDLHRRFYESVDVDEREALRERAEEVSNLRVMTTFFPPPEHSPAVRRMQRTQRTKRMQQEARQKEKV